jgi:hypothetical protein
VRGLVLAVVLFLTACGGGSNTTLPTVPDVPDQPLIDAVDLNPIAPDLVPPLPPDIQIEAVAHAAVSPVIARTVTTTPATYNYSQWDGAYNCTNTARPTDPFDATFTFTKIDNYWYGKFSTGAQGYARYNDVANFINGYPAYSENQPIPGTNLYSIWFSPTGTLLYSVGPKTDATTYYPDRLWTCLKTVQPPPPTTVPRVVTANQPSYNFAQHNGAYTCSNPDRLSDSFPAAFVFSNTQVYWFGKFSSGSEGYATYNDSVNFMNGYPSYMEYPANSTVNTYQVWFSPNGTLQYSIGPRTDSSTYYAGRLWNCTKDVAVPPSVCLP